MGWVEFLKRKWKIQNASQVYVICLVFSVTGTSIVGIKKILNIMFPIESETWVVTVLYFVLIMPVYGVLLLFFGYIFGQQKILQNLLQCIFPKVPQKED